MIKTQEQLTIATDFRGVLSMISFTPIYSPVKTLYNLIGKNPTQERLCAVDAVFWALMGGERVKNLICLMSKSQLLSTCDAIIAEAKYRLAFTDD